MRQRCGSDRSQRASRAGATGAGALPHPTAPTTIKDRRTHVRIMKQNPACNLRNRRSARQGDVGQRHQTSVIRSFSTQTLVAKNSRIIAV
jgi:hypothetical protein